MSSLMTEDFLRNLDKLDLAAKQAILEQLLAEYDRSAPGTFPFPRSAIPEFIMREEQPVNIPVMPPASKIEQVKEYAGKKRKQPVQAKRRPQTAAAGRHTEDTLKRMSSQELR